MHLKLWKIVEAKLAAGVPVPTIILKSRRMGISTLIQAIFAHRAFTRFRCTAKTGAHEHFASSTLRWICPEIPLGMRWPHEHLAAAYKLDC